jgi:hypothetical protein
MLFPICSDPKVTGAMPEQSRLAFRHPTNDLNEGALGTLPQKYRAYSTHFWYGQRGADVQVSLLKIVRKLCIYCN